MPLVSIEDPCPIAGRVHFPSAVRDKTRQGWRGGGRALLIVVWLYGCVVVAIGGWSALALFSTLIALAALVLLLVTRPGAH